ncbi:metal-sensitive transcriptional regulator [Candidatus Saccharibacteria bacterium]|nr:metal-sensitive transcriptional regulator [Candidatus Saccharibacteria bacterium]
MATIVRDSMKYGYDENKPHLINRLKRIEGQVRGVSSMVNDDKYCIDIMTQISAVQSALDKVALELVRDHAKHCLVANNSNSTEANDKANELVNALGRYMR